MKKLKKQIVSTIEKKQSDEYTEGKKEYMINYFYKRKNLLNHLKTD